MRKKKRKLTPYPLSPYLLALFLLLFFGMIGLYIIISAEDQQSEANTVEYNDTVAAVDVTQTENDVHLEIVTESNRRLIVQTSVANQLDPSEIQALQPGEQIFYRIGKTFQQTFEEAGMANIVALRTEDQEFFSLDDYNQYVREILGQGKIACLVAAAVFFLASLYCVLRIKNVTLFSRGKKKEQDLPSH